jgi:hypothetical protein
MSIKQDSGAWRKQVRGLFLGGTALASLAAMSACSGTDSGAPAAVAAKADYVQANANVPGARSLKGKAKGGNQPIAWSIITLYAAGNSGAGSASAIGYGFSDQNGNVTAIYYCPAGNPQVYAVAEGGNAGGGYNTAIGLSAALGQCNSLPSQAVIDEVTTVASVYTLSQFLDTSGQKPGASSTNAAGLNNAIATFANLANLGTGLAQTVLVSGAQGTPPTATVNTLADALAPCVTSSGPSSSQCQALFGATTPSGGSAPGSTLQAALNVARSPGNSVAAVYGLANGGPFQPTLTAAPHDWTMAISFAGGSLNSPFGLAVDASGNVWVANYLSDGSVNSGNGSLVELSATGVQAGPFTDNGHMLDPDAVAIDASGNIWAANGGGTTISGLTSNGTSLASSPFALAGVENPSLIAVNASGDVWTAAGRSATVLRRSASYAAQNYRVSDSTTRTPNLTGLALDNAGNIWLADANSNLLVELGAADPSQQVAGSPHSGGGLIVPQAIALDAAADVWAINSPTLNNSNGVTELVYSATGYTAVNHGGNGVNSATGEAIDGAGNVWIANNDVSGNNGLVVLNASGNPVAGSPYAAGNVLTSQPFAVAIDASGNVWVAGSFGGNVVEVVGAAVPVKTPLIGQPALP